MYIYCIIYVALYMCICYVVTAQSLTALSYIYIYVALYMCICYVVTAQSLTALSYIYIYVALYMCICYVVTAQSLTALSYIYICSIIYVYMLCSNCTEPNGFELYIYMISCRWCLPELPSKLVATIW